MKKLLPKWVIVNVILVAGLILIAEEFQPALYLFSLVGIVLLWDKIFSSRKLAE